MSLAKDQNCATSETLKMPTQMKNATPMYGTRAATAAANSSTQMTKNTRDADEQLHAIDPAGEPAIERHEPHQEEAWPAAAYDRTSAPPPSRISGSRTVLMTE